MKLSHYIYLFLVITIILTNRAFTRDQSKLDSLINKLQLEDDDTARISIYYKITEMLIQSDIDSVKYFIDKGLLLAEEYNMQNYIAKFHSALGDIYVIKNDLYKAMDSYITTLKLYKETNNLQGISLVNLVLGNIRLSQGNYIASLENYQKGLKIADSLKLMGLLPHFYNNIGEINLDLGNYEGAIKNYKKALDIYRTKQNGINTASILNNISQVYIKMGDTETAITYLDKAYRIYDSISDNLGLQKLFTTKGDIETSKGNYQKALEYYLKSNNYLEKIGSEYFGPKSYLYAVSYNNIGLCYLKLKQFDKAKKNLLKANEIAKKMGLLEALTEVTGHLSELYEVTGKPVVALNYYKKYKQYTDSLSNKQNTEQITRLEMEYEFERLLKRKEIEELTYKENQKRKELYYIVIIMVIVVLLIIFVMMFNTQRLKRKNLKLEKEKLRKDLEYKNKELTTNVLYLLKKNEFIINMSKQLKNSRYSLKPENRKIIDGIINDMERSASKDIWKEFELRFQEVHSDFYNKLTSKHPDLSPNELKMCAFLRLNMTTKEISSITFQSYNSIIMARHRLRRKLGISSNENLIIYLRQL